MKSKPGRGERVAAVHRLEDFPETPAPVVAFVGRSNVGKSSLLNRLLGKAAARVSQTPGKTRGIYFYETGDEHCFADLPGAGFARVSGEERRRWQGLADALFRSGRVRLAVLLSDSRVPDAPVDRTMRRYLEGLGVPTLAVATKWDKLGARERAAARRKLEAEHGGVLPVSSRTGEGIEALRREIRRRLKEGGG
ncbi:MAG: ribosome biogenesis GTP-binding protein YihA/YsxC [Acidobacteriota bacterium]